ncbi:MAG TPA: hypothetical protein VM012_11980 [Flavitalea sp.]|nr:hypothetical protein [Flavitalea sp.]
MKISMLLSACLLISFQVAVAQPVPPQKLKLFIECQFSNLCDLDYIRREVVIADYVRNPYQADVHILITSRNTGGASQEHTILLTGKGLFSKLQDTLNFHTPNVGTEAETRAIFLKKLKVALIPFLMKNGDFSKLEVSFSATDTLTHTTSDKWKSWVFNVGGRMRLNGDNNYNEHSIGTNISVGKVTEKFKTGLYLFQSLSKNAYRYLEDSQKIVFKTSNRYVNVRHEYVRSLTPKWSTGYELAYTKSTYDNFKSSWDFYAGIEYNIYPYKISNSKFLALRYRLNAEHRNYYEETLYDKTTELLFSNELSLYTSYAQKWGSVNGSLSWYNYLHDLSKNVLAFNAYMEVRVAKGLSLTFEGNASRINDQLHIAKSGANSQEVLLRLKALSTSYNYYTGFGINYQFGSALNNVVNTRFTNGRMY